MTQLQLIVQREYINEVKSKSFWISTFVFPVVLILFGIFIGFMAADSETLQTVSTLGQDTSDKDLSGAQVIGMMMGMFMTLFIMLYGTQIFNKVRNEKTNRIMEILATCVSGRTMMLGKVIAVGLLGITQMLAWAVLIAGGAICTLSMLNLYDALTILTDTRVLTAAVYGILYFVGGYLLFGSLYACVGAMTDKDNENQGYIALLTFIIMISFYMAQFTIDNQGSQVAVWCSYIPITSPTIGCVQAISGAMAWWEALISLIILYGCAYFSIVIAGKIYTSAMLLTGKKLSLKDLLVFIKAK